MKSPSFILRRSSTILAVSVLTLTLLAAITGSLLAFNYQPTAGGAFESLSKITTEIPFGWLVRRVHDLAGNLVIVVALIQMVVMFLGERYRRSWLTAWISGILFVLAAIGLGWTAMLLDWSQIGFWRLRVELGIIESVPIAGPIIRNILTGGGAIGSVTVAHMYALHSYILSLGAVVLSVIHLTGLVFQEREIAQLAVQQSTSEVVPQSTHQEPDSDGNTNVPA
ncbi:cytochrome bc complex cytochrome b subunit [Phormidium sp. CLA17]|uniref:cytochrome b N-terminal domain-containing protein n=1 Tax=Leptolyngbya sp. Cla-17 TaxID=2803751 RepID=UPI0014913532|nr:cytochrome b N-terminal domain-containing protein [Leptolyngbya sp. Cla-17]MBM0741748.1 cytochrome bc complex cytochrome b subunit [Leptolyngbya sp. Cla-17]